MAGTSHGTSESFNNDDDPCTSYLRDGQGWDWLQVSPTTSISSVKTPDAKTEKDAKKVTPKSDGKNAPDTPKSRTPGKKNLTSRRLKFPEDKEDAIKALEPYHCKRPLHVCEVRDKIEDEYSEENMEAGMREILELVPNIPENGRSFVARRRAAVLPIQCPKCSVWRAPLYQCRHCGTLWLGNTLIEHETSCDHENRIIYK